tara:strand:+ start:341 stop:502 length:162 start_codon:yes stop_codon:yes gene_type:complete
MQQFLGILFLGLFIFAFIGLINIGNEIESTLNYFIAWLGLGIFGWMTPKWLGL